MVSQICCPLCKQFSLPATAIKNKDKYFCPNGACVVYYFDRNRVITDLNRHIDDSYPIILHILNALVNQTEKSDCET